MGVNDDPYKALILANAVTHSEATYYTKADEQELGAAMPVALLYSKPACKPERIYSRLVCLDWLIRRKSMPVRSAQAIWQGTLKEGKGHLKLQSGVYEGPYTFAGRFENGSGTNPEELIGAAHAGCFAMFLSALLGNAGFNPTQLDATARVHLGEGPTLTQIDLHLEATVPGLSQEQFQELAQQAKAQCPISKALAAVPVINLEAVLHG